MTGDIKAVTEINAGTTFGAILRAVPSLRLVLEFKCTKRVHALPLPSLPCLLIHRSGQSQDPLWNSCGRSMTPPEHYLSGRVGRSIQSPDAILRTPLSDQLEVIIDS